MTRTIIVLAATIFLLHPAPVLAQEEEPERFDLGASLGEGAFRLTADRAAELALESAPEMARARAAVEASEASEMEALVPMVPRLDLSARYLRVGGFEDGAMSVGLTDMPLEQALTAAETVEDPAARMLLTEMVGALGGGTEVSFEVPRDQIGFRASLTVPLSDLFTSMLPAYRAAEAQTELILAHRESGQRMRGLVDSLSTEIRDKKTQTVMRKTKGGETIKVEVPISLKERGQTIKDLTYALAKAVSIERISHNLDDKQLLGTGVIELHAAVPNPKPLPEGV